MVDPLAMHASSVGTKMKRLADLVNRGRKRGHNNFGTPMSHGCVNLPLAAARWMYDWAPLGTVVVSHR